MKKFFTLIFLAILGGTATAQCSSGATTYDLTVTGTQSIPPSGPSFTFGIICPTGHLYDSAMCCTRMIHIESGGIYEAGPSAYGMVYMKSGATFDAHGNNTFFGVNYEAGATILNYTGPMTLCPTVTFAAGTCTPTSMEESVSTAMKVYPNPATDRLFIENTGPANTNFAVYDVNGRKVMEVSNVENTIDISALSNGMYSFEVLKEGKKVSYGRFAVAR